MPPYHSAREAGRVPSMMTLRILLAGIVVPALVAILSPCAEAQQPGASAQGTRSAPPQEAFLACQGSQPGATCSAVDSRGLFPGTCEAIQASHLCVPASEQSQWQQGDQPQAEAFQLVQRRPHPRPPGAPQPGQREAGRPGQLPAGSEAGGGMSRFGYDPNPPYAGAKTLFNRLSDTGQVTCFNDTQVIDCPPQGQPFFGQDAHYISPPAAFTINGDGTIGDPLTGPTWQKAHNA